MARFGPKSIRGKITLLAIVATALAMVLIVAVMGYTMRLMLENAIVESLNDRIDQALAEVERGDYAEAVDSSGSEIIQVVDAQGNIVAESRNARGLKALDVDAGTTEVTELTFTRDDEGASDASPVSHVEDEPDGVGDANDASAVSQVEEDSKNIDESGYDDDDSDDENDRGLGYNGLRTYGEADDDDESDEEDDDADESDDMDKVDDADDHDGDADEKADEANTPGDADGEEKTEGNDDEVGDDDEADEADDDVDEKTDDEFDNDADDDERAAKGRPRVQQSSPLQVSSMIFPWGYRVAWAAETSTASASSEASTSAAFSDVVDARSVLGVEGPYIVQRKEAQSPDGPMSIVGVASLASAVHSAWQMAGLLSAIMAGVLVAVVVFAWQLTGRTLRPVEDMRAKAASITAHNLDERIDIPQSDKDLARLAETLNEMLARIGRALDEEKRFISDASHELKSPIAASSIILDSLRTHPEAVDVAHAVEDLTSENSRMASIVSDMLALTRYDEGRLAYRPEPIDLMDLVMEESLSLQARSSVKVDLCDLQPVVCRADSELLAHAVRNVLDNASHYAKQVVKVSCGQKVQEAQEKTQEAREDQGVQRKQEIQKSEGASQKSNAVFIQVSDDGCGIPPADRERVFGRFVCLNEGHTGPQGGTGLGLAVVASAIDAHGGSVAFTDPEIGGATVVIEIPQ